MTHEEFWAQTDEGDYRMLSVTVQPTDRTTTVAGIVRSYGGPGGILEMTWETGGHYYYSYSEVVSVV